VRPQTDSLGDRTGVEILDATESNRYVRYDPEAVSPTSAVTESVV
jgi:hypothetical protein